MADPARRQGPFLAVVRDTFGIVPDNFSIIATPLAVVAGLTYQFLPFMVLPLYVALEKIDKRLIEAARDLYAGPWRRGGAIAGAIAGGATIACRPDRSRLCLTRGGWGRRVRRGGRRGGPWSVA